jgi:hypothetical protein
MLIFCGDTKSYEFASGIVSTSNALISIRTNIFRRVVDGIPMAGYSVSPFIRLALFNARPFASRRIFSIS